MLSGHFLKYLSVCVVLASSVGCVGPVHPIHSSFQQLNGSNEFRVGSIYVFSRSGPVFVEDVLSAVSLNYLTSIRREANASIHSSFELGRYSPNSNYVTSDDAVRIAVHGEAITRQHLDQPDDCIEALNRPVSALFYNLETERRWTDLRVALQSVLAQWPKEVYLCIATDKIPDAKVTLTCSGANAPNPQTLLRDLFSSTAVVLDRPKVVEQNTYVFPVRSAITKRVLLRRLISVDASTTPKIEFALGGTLELSYEGAELRAALELDSAAIAYGVTR